MNIAGTRRVVELCRKMTHLASLVHVSTAYCNCDREEITEAVYPLPMKPQQLIDTVEWMDNGLAQKIVPELVGDRPNTYTFTKAMAEYMLVEECSDMPIAIVRPSIVTAAWKEPIPGWVDNLNGPIGLLIGAGKGLMRSTLCQGTYVADFIPVDIPINLMIAAAWLTATDRFDNLMVYNCTSGDLNPMTWNDMVRYSFPVAVKNPLTGALWYPSTRFPTNRLVHNYHGVFLQYVNAYIIDSAAWLVGKKRRLVNIQEKVCRAQKSLEYFTTHQWRFTNDNIKMIWEKLQPADKELFPFDVTEVVWLPFWQNYWLGGKFFVLRETLETIPTARSHNNRMLIVDHIYQSLKLLILWRVLRANSSIIFGASNWFVKAMSRFSSLLPFQRGT